MAKVQNTTRVTIPATLLGGRSGSDQWQTFFEQARDLPVTDDAALASGEIEAVRLATIGRTDYEGITGTASRINRGYMKANKEKMFRAIVEWKTEGGKTLRDAAGRRVPTGYLYIYRVA